MAKGLFVAVEGLDGVGKTTLAKGLAASIGAQYFATPPADLAEADISGHSGGLRAAIEDNHGPSAKLSFYLLGLAVAAERIERGRHEGPVICDRYIASTYAYHSVALSSWICMVDSLALPIPDVTLFLSAREAERHARIGGRAASREYGLCGSDRSSAVTQRYLAYPGLTTIDTSGRTAEWVLRRSQEELERRTAQLG